MSTRILILIFTMYDMVKYQNHYENLLSKHEKLKNLTEIQPEKQYQNNYEKEDPQDDLINELFNEFQIDENKKEK